LLLGDPGTGKSLIGRALASHLTKIYRKEQIVLRDVLCWPNRLIPSEPRISCHPAGKGKHKVKIEKLKHEKKKRAKNYLISFLSYFLTTVGGIFISAGIYFLWEAYSTWLANPMTAFGPLQAYYDYNLMKYLFEVFISIGAQTFLPAGMMLIFLILIIFLGRYGFSNAKGISGSEQTEAPKLIVDNSEKVAPFVDATGHKSAQLFGSIAWDPLQTGGLGTPEHQRTSAGDVHKANLGILYIDEIKNLHPEEAITLLTVLEEGQLPITLRSKWSASGTSAMAVSTEPVPCLCFLVAAGNFDSINQIHPALFDRIYGYGKVVRMNNDMPNTVENRRKYVQFIAQESKRFHLKPFSREACIEICNEGRRRSNKSDALTTKFRPLISIIKTAATLAENEKSKFVERKHVIEAVNQHCKTIQKQILEHQMRERGKLLEIEPKGKKLGTIYGLAVVSDPHSGEKTGNVLRVKATMTKTKKRKSGYFKVSGIAKEGKFIHDSAAKVRSVIMKKYGVDIAQDYCTHIDFSQAYGVDGPSAGVTMAILLCALLEGKPISQDIAVTGELNISSTDEIGITAVGGLYEKIKAAEKWGFKKVIIPEKNYRYSIDIRDYALEVIPAKTLDDYLKIILAKDGIENEKESA
ncbi:MAG: S16 family serine protease, partial [Candidatus Hodarchaeales archaeon]